jgi:excinuclease ABC subunit A
MDKIIIKGAKTHNLKNIDLEIPRDKFVVITGLSGSGKSSLAFDTIYVEGQRRYVESLSSYARQFLGQMQKPPVESIVGLSPAIAIQQKGKGYNPRSTVGTMTEIYDYMRVLFARAGTPYCPICGDEVKPQSIQEIVDIVLNWENDTRVWIMSPLVKGRKGEYNDLFNRLRKDGFTRVKIDGEVFNLEEEINLDKNKKHNIYLVVDRLKVSSENRTRISDSIETALKEANGDLIVLKNDEEIYFSESFSCPKCGISFQELNPRMFSFNNPYGACPECSGLGMKMDFDLDLIIPDKTKSINDGALNIMGFSESGYSMDVLNSVGKHYKFSLDIPFEKMDKKDLDILLYGTNGEKIKFKYEDSVRKYEYTKDFEGIIPMLWRRYKQTTSEDMKYFYEKLMRTYTCPTCKGDRLKPESLAVKIFDKNIIEISSMQIKNAKIFFESLTEKLDEKQQKISNLLIKEIKERLNFLFEVGLGYLSLMRKSNSLSGGEAQRINLATQIGAGLMGVLYVLDEPSIGLHQRDNEKLLNTIKRLRDLGNTVLVVEHDEETIREADFIVDLGPGAGIYGGEIVASGTLADVLKSERSLTAKYLNGEIKIEVPTKRRKPKSAIKIIGATENNLKDVDVEIPLGVLVAIAGVSGSGKSTLIEEILYKNIFNHLNRSNKEAGKCRKILGLDLDLIDKIINIDQSPIGRTPRSNPATYTGIWTEIRDLFASIPEAKMRGYKQGRFSFNVRGGRCEACQGEGQVKIEMHFLPDVFVECEVCKGKRFERETLEIKYKGKNISDVLDMSIDEAYDFFEKIPKVERGLRLLKDVGLGYMKLGQSAITLSGGEAQRIKLATELSKRATGKTFYILDEPTTGLHFADVHKLIDVLQRLVDKGNTVLVIEHNLDVLKTSDYIIDLGPEGGDEGGEIVAKGTPEEVAKEPKSHTGRYLQEIILKKIPTKMHPNAKKS